MLQSVFVDFFLLGRLLLEHFVASQESLDGFDTDRYELRPCDLTVFVFISESEKHADVVFAEVVRWKQLESIVELLVRQLTVCVCVSLCEKQSQRPLKSLDEPR